MENKEKNFISAVVYLHNSAPHIEGFLRTVCGVLEENFEKYEIICVNDASDDDGAQAVHRFADSLDGPVLSIIHMSFYQGVDLAMNAGVDLAIGDFVFEFDSAVPDFPSASIMEVYRHSLEGYDIVSAAPAQMRRRSSQLFYRIYNRFSGSPYKLRTESFRILSRRAINRVHAMSKTVPYRKALYANCGLKLDVLPYQPVAGGKPERDARENELRQEKAVDSLILFTDVAYKAALFMTCAMMCMTVVTAVYAFAIFIGQKPVAGWTTTMLFLSGAFFAVFAILAVIIKYLSILVDLVFKKQKYTIESIEKLTK